jgi:hypothetical protein
MSLIMQVDTVDMHNVGAPFHPMTFLVAHGQVSSSGWSAPQLAPRYYVVPPADGMWDIDFIADAPSGIVLTVNLPVSASRLIEVPAWFKGVRVHAEQGFVEAKQFGKALSATSAIGSVVAIPMHKDVAPLAAAAIVSTDLAIYDDSFQPTGNTKFDPWPHVEMKKLRHHLTLTVSGPDEQKIRSCINQAIGAGLLVAIAAAYTTGGLGLSAAVTAFLSSLTSCLGNGFEAKVDDRSYWITWWT